MLIISSGPKTTTRIGTQTNPNSVTVAAPN